MVFVCVCVVTGLMSSPPTLPRVLQISEVSNTALNVKLSAIAYLRLITLNPVIVRGLVCLAENHIGTFVIPCGVVFILEGFHRGSF